MDAPWSGNVTFVIDSRSHGRSLKAEYQERVHVLILSGILSMLLEALPSLQSSWCQLQGHMSIQRQPYHPLLLGVSQAVRAKPWAIGTVLLAAAQGLMLSSHRMQSRHFMENR